MRRFQNTASRNRRLSRAGRPLLPAPPGRWGCKRSQIWSVMSCRRCAGVIPPPLTRIPFSPIYHPYPILTTLPREYRRACCFGAGPYPRTTTRVALTIGWSRSGKPVCLIWGKGQGAASESHIQGWLVCSWERRGVRDDGGGNEGRRHPICVYRNRQKKTGEATLPGCFQWDALIEKRKLRGDAYFFINILGTSTQRLNRPMNAPPATMASIALTLLRFSLCKPFCLPSVTEKYHRRKLCVN